MDISMKTAAVNLNAFHQFAAFNQEDDNRIAQFGATRTIQVATGDHVRTPFRDALRAGLFKHWGCHGEANAEANDKIRAFFITSLLRTLGCNLEAYGIAYDAQTGRYSGINEANLKAAARSVFNNDEAAVKVLKLGDYGCGRPLTVRRITAAISVLDKTLMARARTEGENGVNRQQWYRIHTNGFAEVVGSQDVQGANEQPQPGNVQPQLNDNVHQEGGDGQMRAKFIDLPRSGQKESGDMEPRSEPGVTRDRGWAVDVIKKFRVFLAGDDIDFYTPHQAKAHGETYNALVKLGEESDEVRELLDQHQDLLAEMRNVIEDRLRLFQE